ncbi:MAG: hypothetical protein J6A19_12335 [Oscillospiraceae bacterium]|nr:hypothetical protein [Oscillospiraceae bacterium]
MGKFILKRIGQLILSMVIASILVFIFVRLSDTDPVAVILGGKQTSQETIQAIKEKFNLDKPIFQQYLLWIDGLFHGDLGLSFKYQTSINELIGPRILTTLRSYLPEKMQEALKQADIDGDYSRPEVVEASAEYYRRHVCRIVPYPDFVERSFSQMGEPYMVMQGASEFVVTGKMKDWDYSDRLDRINIPTLVTSGIDDEATPAVSKQIYDGVKDCRWELIPGTHLCHVEYPDLYNSIVEKFMEEHE